MSKATRNKFDDMRDSFMKRLTADEGLTEAFRQIDLVEKQQVIVSDDSISQSNSKLPYSGASPVCEQIWN